MPGGGGGGGGGGGEWSGGGSTRHGLWKGPPESSPLGGGGFTDKACHASKSSPLTAAGLGGRRVAVWSWQSVG